MPVSITNRLADVLVDETATVDQTTGILKVTAAITTGPTTVADGADVAEGATTDAAITTDVNGTISGKLRGLVKILSSVWDSVNGRLKVDGSSVTQPVSAASLPLPTGAATEGTLGTRLADATFASRINVQGQQPSAASTPVVLASDQPSIPVAATVGNFPVNDPVDRPFRQIGVTSDDNVEGASLRELRAIRKCLMLLLADHGITPELSVLQEDVA